MRNVGKYIEKTANHTPKGYDLTVGEIEQLHNAVDCYEMITNSFKLGFETAYRAAKYGKLDFQ